MAQKLDEILEALRGLKIATEPKAKNLSSPAGGRGDTKGAAELACAGRRARALEPWMAVLPARVPAMAKRLSLCACGTPCQLATWTGLRAR